jgi:hypothetical protein
LKDEAIVEKSNQEQNKKTRGYRTAKIKNSLKKEKQR